MDPSWDLSVQVGNPQTDGTVTGVISPHIPIYNMGFQAHPAAWHPNLPTVESPPYRSCGWPSEAS